MGGVLLYLDTILVPLSLFITVGYHAYLWHHFKNQPFITTIGINIHKRRLWLQLNHQGDEKKGMLAVQSIRNTLMDTILAATVTILIILSLGALISNTYHVNHLFNPTIFGSQSRKILMLKYGSASIFLLFSFLCSSLALGYLVDANFLINALGEFSSSRDYTRRIFERGFMLAMVGNRVLCMTLPLLLWMLGPVPVVLAALGLVRGLYELDFVGSFTKANKKSLTT